MKIPLQGKIENVGRYVKANGASLHFLKLTDIGTRDAILANVYKLKTTKNPLYKKVYIL